MGWSNQEGESWRPIYASKESQYALTRCHGLHVIPRRKRYRLCESPVYIEFAHKFFELQHKSIIRHKTAVV